VWIDRIKFFNGQKWLELAPVTTCNIFNIAVM
jgi:hypothetical protein